jgi:hypothetical protein
MVRQPLQTTDRQAARALRCAGCIFFHFLQHENIFGIIAFCLEIRLFLLRLKLKTPYIPYPNIMEPLVHTAHHYELLNS